VAGSAESGRYAEVEDLGWGVVGWGDAVGSASSDPGGPISGDVGAGEVGGGKGVAGDGAGDAPGGDPAAASGMDGGGGGEGARAGDGLCPNLI